MYTQLYCILLVIDKIHKNPIKNFEIFKYLTTQYADYYKVV